MNQNQKALHDLWEQHIRHEFATHDTEETLATMVDAGKLPVAGVESARKVLDPKLPSNALMHRVAQR